MTSVGLEMENRFGLKSGRRSSYQVSTLIYWVYDFLNNKTVNLELKRISIILNSSSPKLAQFRQYYVSALVCSQVPDAYAKPNGIFDS